MVFSDFDSCPGGKLRPLEVWSTDAVPGHYAAHDVQRLSVTFTSDGTRTCRGFALRVSLVEKCEGVGEKID